MLKFDNGGMGHNVMGAMYVQTSKWGYGTRREGG